MKQYELFEEVPPNIPADCLARSADIARVSMGADTITEEVYALQEAAFRQWEKGGYSFLCFQSDRPVMSFNALFRAVCTNILSEQTFNPS